MWGMSRFILLVLLMIFVPAVALGQNAASTAPTSDALVQALLVEVRQLRLALERSAIVAPRIQVMLQRVQMQQDAANRASKDLDDVRNQILNLANQERGTTTQLKEMEKGAEVEQDPARRKSLENEAQMFKGILEQQATSMTQMRAREAEAEGRLQTEQAKLSELNERLNVLERQLEPPAWKQP
jgi:predicted  nucleic acid-binding Zn-ribbon protein